jgi:hypothetical protein
VFNELFEVFLSNNYFSVFSVDSVAIKIGFQEPTASYRFHNQWVKVTGLMDFRASDEAR